jgi:GAF domain-containing protein
MTTKARTHVDRVRAANVDLKKKLVEALEQQTATSEVLRVISSSPGELEPVFATMLGNAVRICAAKFGTLYLREGDGFRAVALHNAPPAFAEARAAVAHPPPDSPFGRAAKTKQAVQVADVTKTQGYLAGDPFVVSAVERGGYRTVLSVPMLKEDELIGAINIYRQEVRSFTDKQVELVSNFAKQAVIAIENTRLLNELRQRTDDLSEALEQQTATGEILASLSGSIINTQPVFDAIVRNLLRLFGTSFATVQLVQDEMMHLVAFDGEPGFENLAAHFPLPLDHSHVNGYAVLAKQVVQFAPMLGNPAVPPSSARFAGRFGYNSMIAAPMLRGNDVIGAIGTARRDPKPFNDKQVELLKAFANQAVIAIENTRLLNELRQRTEDLSAALDQQTGMSEVLRVISSSPTDLAPVFDTILTNATRLCEGNFALLCRDDGGVLVGEATCNGTPEFTEKFMGARLTPGKEGPTRLAALERRTVHVADMTVEPGFSPVVLQYEQARTVLAVPLLRETNLVGVITIWRREVRPFTEQQVALVQAFADQAAIAIENTRLLTELRESLQQQTATADVLKVISRSTFDLQTVFDALVDSAARLCEAESAFIYQYGGNVLRMAAGYNVSPGLREFEDRNPLRLARDSGAGRAALERRTIHIADVQADPEYTYGAAWVSPYRTVLAVPMLRDDELLGAVIVFRHEVRPFTDKQTELLTTFADQAAIAIQNVRLFDEVQERTRELTETLEHQTATSEVLNVITRSPTDAQPVFDAIVQSAARLCEAVFSGVFLYDGDLLHVAATHNFTPEVLNELFQTYPKRPDRSVLAGRAVLDGRIAHVPDVLADREYAHQLALAGKWRAGLAVPMLKDGKSVGAISVARAEPVPFSERQVQLLTTFADQAVIAIENVRLFNEIQDKSRQLAEASERKSQFLASMSHELRTPLNAIIGLTEMMVANAPRFGTEKALEPLRRVNAAGTHLLSLINEILDLSKIEAGKLELNPEPVDLPRLIDEVIGTAGQLAEKNKNRLIVGAQENVGALTADSMRLKQILSSSRA